MSPKSGRSERRMRNSATKRKRDQIVENFDSNEGKPSKIKGDKKLIKKQKRLPQADDNRTSNEKVIRDADGLAELPEFSDDDEKDIHIDQKAQHDGSDDEGLQEEDFNESEDEQPLEVLTSSKQKDDDFVELYIGNLPKGVSEEELCDFIGVQSVRISCLRAKYENGFAIVSVLKEERHEALRRHFKRLQSSFVSVAEAEKSTEWQSRKKVLNDNVIQTEEIDSAVGHTDKSVDPAYDFGRQLLASNISNITTEEELCSLLHADDAVISESRKHATLRAELLYLSYSDAQKALKKYNGRVVHGRKIALAPRMKMRKGHNLFSVFVHNLDYKTTEDDLKCKFRKSLDVTIFTDARGVSKRCACIDFQNVEDLFVVLGIKKTVVLHDRILNISMLKSMYSYDTPSTDLFITNLPSNTTDNDLKKQFPKASTIKIARTDFGQCEGTAYLKFKSVNQATSVMSKWNHRTFDGNKIGVVYRIMN